MAARTLAPKFGSYALDLTNDVVVTQFTPSILSSVKWKDRLKGDGSNPISEKFSGATVRIGGKVSGTDSGDARDNVDGLLQALTNGEQALQYFSDRRLLCRLDRGGLQVAPVKGSQGTVFVWSCRMRSRWPFWESPTTTTQSFLPTGSGPHTMVLATNTATHPIWPRITVKSNFSFSNATIRLNHVGTTKQIEFIGFSLNSGEQVVIDTKEKRLGDGITTPKTPVTFNPVYWPLTTGATNTIELSHSVGGSADWVVTVDYESAYWGW